MTTDGRRVGDEFNRWFVTGGGGGPLAVWRSAFVRVSKSASVR